MTIAHDAQTRFPATDGTTGINSVDTTTGDRTFSHDPVGVPKGVVVVICGPSQPTALVSGVLYAGVAMTDRGQALDSDEAAQVHIFTLTGRVVPLDDPATVTLQGCTAAEKWATCSTVTAATNGTTVDDTTFVNTTTSTNPQVTMTGSVATLSYGAATTGIASPLNTAGSGCTIQFHNDSGAQGQSSIRRTSQDAAGSPVLGFTLGTVDDWCMAGVALAEATVPATYYVKSGGSDGAAGTSIASAWASVSRVNTAALGTLIPGDVVSFEGGTTFTGELDIYRSGSSGSPITFTSYGTGQAVLSEGLWMHQVSWVTIDNLTVTQSGYLSAYSAIASSGTGSGVTHLTISNCSLGDAKIAVNSTNTGDSDWLIDNNLIQHTGDSGMILFGPSFVVTDNTLYDIGFNADTFGKHGIYSKSAGAQILRNTITLFYTEGISTRWRDAEIRENIIRTSNPSAGGLAGAIGYYRQDPSTSAGTTYITDNVFEDVGYTIYVSPDDHGYGTPIEYFVISGNVVILRPDGDISDGTWTTQAGGTDLTSVIDEPDVDDADYIRSATSPASADLAEVSLDAGVDPVSASGHIVRYRYGKDASGGDTIDLTVRLVQATTVIASWSHADIGAGWTLAEQTLSSGEANAISDYTNLRLRFEAVEA